MGELALNGETHQLSEDKGHVSVCPVSLSKDDTCDPFETDNSFDDSQLNPEGDITSSEIKTRGLEIENGEKTVPLHGDTTIDLKDSADINNAVDEADLHQQNSLENDFPKNTVDEQMYKNKIVNLESELSNYKNKYEILFNNSTTIDAALHDAQKKLKDVSLRLEQKDVDLSQMELKFQATSNRMQEEILAAEKCKNDANEYEQLRSQLSKITLEKETLLTDNEQLHINVEKFQNMLLECQEKSTLEGQGQSATTNIESGDISQLEKSLNEANDKISELLKVKERYAEVDLEKTNLGNNLSELEEEMDVLSFQTRTATACSMVPLVILVLAIMVAYLPYLSSLFGTVD